jgi:hypothetical protein
MGILGKFNQKNKNEKKKKGEEILARIDEFKAEVKKLGQRYGMGIVAVIKKYGPEIEIEVIEDRDPNKPLNFDESTPETSKEEMIEKFIDKDKGIEDGHRIEKGMKI